MRTDSKMYLSADADSNPARKTRKRVLTIWRMADCGIYIMVTIQSHAKLRSANACIQADKQFYMAK